MLMIIIAAVSVLARCCVASAAASTYTNPVLAGDWPDPGAIYVNGSFLVATTGGGFALHRSDDLGRWSAAGSVFNREDLPRWATGDFWAPEIHRMPDGSFNAYHTARDSAGRLSIGCATSYLSPTGPFRPLDAPLARDLEGGGMYLDSHYFFDNATSTGFLLWKHGSVTPPAETHTWLYMQPLDVSGTRLVGERLTVLRNNLSSWEAGVVEAPWIVRPPGSVDGYYYLFYSAAHCCDGSGSYAVGVARARAVTGPYEKYAQNPILASTKDAESGGFDGTGHCSVIQDPQDSRTWIIFYHAYVRPARSGARVLMMDTLRFDAVGGWPRLTTGTGSPSTKPTPLPPTKSDDDAAQPVDQRHDTAVLPRPFAVLESALAKPRPAGAYYTDQAVLQVHCAKNEVESFIVVISGGSAGLTGVTVDFTVPLAGATVSLHAARYVNATKSTGCSGATGLWADPLVPDVDVYVGEQRNAFPLAVPAGENRLVWVDVYVPKNASAGSSAHPVRVAGAGGFSATLHVNLTIFGFTLPTTPSMRSLFGMPTWNAVAASHNTTDDPRLTNALYKRYLKSGLMHRVSFGNFLSDGSARMQRDAAGVGGNASTARFVDEWGEFISNVELPFGPSPGRLSSVQAPALICGLSWDKHSNRFNNCTATEHTEQIGYWRNLSRVFEERGWLPLLFDYSVDEPECRVGDRRWEVLRRRAAMVRAAGPRMQTLVTTSAEAARNHSAQRLIDVYVPIINDLSLKKRAKPDPDKSSNFCEQKSLCPPKVESDQRSLYDFVKPGNLWTYQSCMSCCGPNSTCAENMNDENSGCSEGWPSYAIDHVDPSGRASGLVNRVMEWASYLSRVDGELYSAVGLNLNTPGAFWESARFYGGNGDDYMLYPGTPDRIGGRTGIPIESIRFKHLRDGYEDNEYLRLLEVLRYVTTFMHAAFSWDDDIGRFEALRVRIGRAIEGASSQGLGV